MGCIAICNAIRVSYSRECQNSSSSNQAEQDTEHFKYHFSPKKSLTDNTESYSNHARAFEVYYAASPMDVRDLDITDNMISSNLLAPNFRAYYVRYTRVTRMLFKIRIISLYL